MISLDGAVVCVTGAGRGIGRATATELARRGARVWIGDLDTEEATRAAAEIGAKSMHLDVTKVDSLEKFWAAASVDGPVEMLVNNAGIMRLGPFVDQSLQGHHQEVAVNLGGVINGMHVFLPDMLARNHGHIVNVASMAAKVTTPGIAVLRIQVRSRGAIAGGTRRDRPHRSNGDHGDACGGQYRTHLGGFVGSAADTRTRAGRPCHRRHRSAAGR